MACQDMQARITSQKGFNDRMVLRAAKRYRAAAIDRECLSVNCPEPEECRICNWNGDLDVEGSLSFPSSPDHSITVLVERFAEEIAADLFGFEPRLSK